MQCTGGTRTTVRAAARTAALVAGAAVLFGGLGAASELVASAPGPAASSAVPATVPSTASATLLVALPDRIGASNRAW